MSNIVINTFTQFKLNEHEQLSGSLMSNEQKMFVQTHIASIAEQRLALTPNPESYAEFIQQEAYLKGQMDFAKFLLDSSTASENAVVAAQSEQQPS